MSLAGCSIRFQQAVTRILDFSCATISFVVTLTFRFQTKVARISFNRQVESPDFGLKFGAKSDNLGKMEVRDWQGSWAFLISSPATYGESEKETDL